MFHGHVSVCLFEHLVPNSHPIHVLKRKNKLIMCNRADTSSLIYVESVFGVNDSGAKKIPTVRLRTEYWFVFPDFHII